MADRPSSTSPTSRSASFFHAYDIRGRFPAEISTADAERLGRAIARTFRGSFVVGRDTRKESIPFSRALSRGLLSAGVRVRAIGIVPTPVVAFVASRWGLVGLSATPSHNALGYVGLKGFDPHGRIFGNEWDRIRAHFEAGFGPLRRTSRGTPRPAGPTATQVRREYLRWVCRGPRLSGTVVLDPRGGTTALLSVRAFRSIGTKVVSLNARYSSNFFGHSPEPRPEDLGRLGREVRRARAFLGATWDGDGDRVLIVDDEGKWVEPELLAVLLYERTGGNRGPLVATIDASRRLEDLVPVARSRVGTRFVIEAMRAANASVGVEASSHIYLGRDYESSDGVRVAIEVARLLAAEPESVQALRRRFGPIVRATGTLTLSDFNEAKRAYRAVRAAVPRRAARSLEGFRVRDGRGDVLVRRSNTQPSVRFAIEASGPNELRELVRWTGRWVREVQVKDHLGGKLRFTP
jgi:phosphomannomutase